MINSSSIVSKKAFEKELLYISCDGSDMNATNEIRTAKIHSQLLWLNYKINSLSSYTPIN